MDFAYDHIQEQSYSSDRSTTPRPSDHGNNNEGGSDQQPVRQNLQTEFQETFKAFSASPWGTKLGGWWSSARTQGASYYETARREAEKAEAEAARALEEARKVVIERTKTVVEAAEEQLDSIVNEERKEKELLEQKQKDSNEKDISTTQQEPNREGGQREDEDTETFLNRFKAEAAKRLKEVQAAEEAADDAILRFGTNIRNFLRDTISITAPDGSSSSGTGDMGRASEVLFESRDAGTGKRVIHASRFDAQLHVIHTTPASFTKDPDGSGEEWEDFKRGFNVEEKTDDIARDLNKYPELRNAMEKLMSEEVEYKDFWTRYYFLRHVVEMQEEKRKEMLKASIASDQEVGWDEDSEDEEETEKQDAKKTATPQVQVPAVTTKTAPDAVSQKSLPQDQNAGHGRTDSDAMTLRPSRRSHDEKSVADSEASYDLVSGAASHAASSPKEKPVKEESDDDDWE